MGGSYNPPVLTMAAAVKWHLPYLGNKQETLLYLGRSALNTLDFIGYLLEGLLSCGISFWPDAHICPMWAALVERK